MPQGDILGFGPTVTAVAIAFLGGYYTWATVWAPRVILTLRARHWVTAAVVVTPAEGWPEIFLAGIQFAGLVWVITRVVTPPGVAPLGAPVRLAPVVPTLVAPAAGVLHLWSYHRGDLFFRPAAAELTRVVTTVLGGHPGWIPTRVFPVLGGRLRGQLARVYLGGPDNSTSRVG